MNRVLIALATLLAWTVLVFFVAWNWRGSRADVTAGGQVAATATAAVAQINETRAIEHNHGRTLASIGDTHEEDRALAPAVADAVVADVGAGTLRLRDGWASCETQRLSDAATAAIERDAAAQRRAEFAGAVVRVGRDADDQLRACQAVIAADRAAPP